MAKNKPQGFRPPVKSFSVQIRRRDQRPDARRTTIGTVRKAMLKVRYPKANYDPLPGCQFCHGFGEVQAPGRKLIWKPCICLFVKHDEIDLTLRALENAVNSPEEIAKLQAWAGVQAWQEVK